MPLTSATTAVIPAEAVPRRQRVDGALEKIIPSSKLREGMIIVCLNPDTPAGEPETHWCRVESLLRENGRLTFTALYADGKRYNRPAHEHLKWIVKKSSCP